MPSQVERVPQYTLGVFLALLIAWIAGRREDPATADVIRDLEALNNALERPDYQLAGYLNEVQNDGMPPLSFTACTDIAAEVSRMETSPGVDASRLAEMRQNVKKCFSHVPTGDTSPFTVMSKQEWRQFTQSRYNAAADKQLAKLPKHQRSRVADKHKHRFR